MFLMGCGCWVVVKQRPDTQNSFWSRPCIQRKPRVFSVGDGGGGCSKPRVFSVGDGGMTEQTTCFIGWVEHAVFAHLVFYGVSVSFAPWPGRAGGCSMYGFCKFDGVLTIGLKTLF